MGEGILAAFDDAIADGVDVISISMTPGNQLNLDADPISIGGFHAKKRGIVTVQSAGNEGAPFAGSTNSMAPWLLSVAASTIDRKFASKIVLGNGDIVTGYSVNGFTPNGKQFPLVDGINVTSEPFCIGGPRSCNCIDNSLAKGKIVLCNTTEWPDFAMKTEAKGVIYIYERPRDVQDVVPLPGTALDTRFYLAVDAYRRSTLNPVVKILKSETVTDPGAPVVATFSCRGPNVMPDVSAPGVDILAGWSPAASPNDVPYDHRTNNFNVMYGTSMSCPHVAGIAAYIKFLHPNWSPSAIKSAIMTTAAPMHPVTARSFDAEFAYGSGQLNPANASNPGLVYETSPIDDVNLLCNLGYSTAKVRSITGDKTRTCTGRPDPAAINDFNYPSITAALQPKSVASFSIRFTRTVTNVGSENSTYKARVVGGKGLKIEVTPAVLSFGCLDEKMSFNVTVSGGDVQEKGFFGSAALIWSDGMHSVRSPVVIYTP
ncbi:Subtilisin-like protease SBT4.4 [Linum grandiflorum]